MRLVQTFLENLGTDLRNDGKVLHHSITVLHNGDEVLYNGGIVPADGDAVARNYSTVPANRSPIAENGPTVGHHSTPVRSKAGSVLAKRLSGKRAIPVGLSAQGEVSDTWVILTRYDLHFSYKLIVLIAQNLMLPKSF
jgi:hypothetical protein